MKIYLTFLYCLPINQGCLEPRNSFQSLHFANSKISQTRDKTD